jgi:hypothetical protein
MKTSILCISMLGLFGCGGGDAEPSRQATLETQIAEKVTQIKNLQPESPCSTNDHCTVRIALEQATTCPPSFLPGSSMSPNGAAVQALVVEHNTLSDELKRLVSPGVACTTGVWNAPPAVCEQSKCRF